MARMVVGILAVGAVLGMGAACGEITVPPTEGADLPDAIGGADTVTPGDGALGDTSANLPPEITVTGAPTEPVSENAAVTFQVAGSDPDGHNVIVDVDDKTLGAVIANGVLTWTPPGDTVSCQAYEQKVTIKLVAVDDGTPPRTAELAVDIVVHNDFDGDKAFEPRNDRDGDGVDAGDDPDDCDEDFDNDGVDDGSDNCIELDNAGQENADNDDLGDACDPDRDGDTVDNGSDNCPDVPNDDQENSDADPAGDACDTDDDNDDVLDVDDNCRVVPNENQADLDEDDIGDACDECQDPDKDGAADEAHAGQECPLDNCPGVSNPGQENSDDDAQGDACDTDADNDGIPNEDDNCFDVPNTLQENADGDDLGDACDDCELDADNDVDEDGVCGDVDNCVDIWNQDQANDDNDKNGNACDDCPQDPNDDQDSDNVCGDVDNCPLISNADQTNTDGLEDGGDACDTDDDEDGHLDAADNCPVDSNPQQEDLNGDGEGDACDDDDDGDGQDDGVDNCPLAANPEQLDIDEDGKGYVCDDLVVIWDALHQDGAALNILGAARADSVALVFAGAPDCANAVEGQCLKPGIMHIQDDGVANLELPAWIGLWPGGAVVPPFMPKGSPGAAIFMARNGTGEVEAELAVDGGNDSLFAFSMTEFPQLLETDTSQTLAISGGRLLTFTPASAPELIISGADYEDSSGATFFSAPSGGVYIPSKNGQGKVSLRAFAGDTDKVVFADAVAVAFLGYSNDITWYCGQETASSQRAIVGLLGNAVKHSWQLAGADSCLGVTMDHDPAGRQWFTYATLGGATREVSFWEPGTANGEPVLPGNNDVAAIHFAGPETYVTRDCGTGCVDVLWFDPSQGALVPVWTLDQRFKRLVATSGGGHLAVLTRGAQVGPTKVFVASIFRTQFAEGQLNDTEALPLITGPWIGYDGVAWAHVNFAGVSALYAVVQAGTASGATVQAVASTTGQANVTSTPNGTLVSWNGPTAKLATAKISDATVVLGSATSSTGIHAPLLPAGETAGDGSDWVAYPKGGGLQGIGTMLTGAFSEVRDDLNGPPFGILQDEADRWWIGYDTSDGRHYARMLDGALVDVRSGAADVDALRATTLEGDRLWGFTHQAVPGDPFEVCRVLAGAIACWRAPEDSGGLLWGPEVTSRSRAYAVVDHPDHGPALWHNIGSGITEPLPAP